MRAETGVARVHFLYPSSPLRARQPDEIYSDEFAAVSAVGFGTSVFSFEEFQAGSFHAFPVLPHDIVVYRGWMMSAQEYSELESCIIRSGACPLTDSATYLATHHLPNWYRLIAEFTPETRMFAADADLASELRALNWPAYFVKDYVKSLKTAGRSRISTPEQATAVVEEMKRFRGVIEGGFCVRRVEDFLPETERRFFVVDSRPFAATGSVPSVVSECAQCIRSRFFSVDVVQRSDGVMRIVEVGDGQVSDLVGWTPERFAEVFAEVFPVKDKKHGD
jgi:hypothetical protein